MSETNAPPTCREAVFWEAVSKAAAKEADRCRREIGLGSYEVHAILRGRVIFAKGRRRAENFDERVLSATVEVREPRDTISSPKSVDLVAAIFCLLGVKSAKRVAVQLATFRWESISEDARHAADELLATMKTRTAGSKKRVEVTATIDT